MAQVDWVLLGRYAAGDCAEAERAAVDRRLAESPDHRAALAMIQRVTTQARTAAVPEVRAAHLANVKARAAAIGPRVFKPAPIWRRAAVWKIAAAAVLAISTSVLGYRTLSTGSESAASPTVHTITTVRGQRMSLRLGDGTAVMLAPSSTLRFSSAYGVRDRTVELDGEAAFTVTHDEQRPFAVRTPQLLARDLGTRFVVRAYRQDSVAHVAVAEGEVAVTRDSVGDVVDRSLPDSVVLLAGDVAWVTSGAHLVTAHAASLDSYFGWTEGRLVFDRTPLATVSQRIEQWHDVEVRLATPELARLGFTASFKTGEVPSEMLRVIASTLELELVQTSSRSYLLRARQSHAVLRRPA